MGTGIAAGNAFRAVVAVGCATPHLRTIKATHNRDQKMPNYLRFSPDDRPVFLTFKTVPEKPVLVSNREYLHRAFSLARQRHPFEIVAVVLLPDHCHLLMRLPNDDGDFSRRLSVIKSLFSRQVPKTDEPVSASRVSRRERGIWQRRFWDHVIRSERDFKNHIDYIHYNPVKHGYVKRAIDWLHSTFHRYLAEGVYAPDWGTRAGDLCEPENTGE